MSSPALYPPPPSKTRSQAKTGQRKAIVGDGHPALWCYQAPWSQDGRSEVCYPEGTHPSPQKRWGQEAEVVVLQPRKWDWVSAVQGSLRWALWLALGRRSDHITTYASLPQHRGVGNSLSLKSILFPLQCLDFLAKCCDLEVAVRKYSLNSPVCLLLTCPEVFCSIAACSNAEMQLCPCSDGQSDGAFS